MPSLSQKIHFLKIILEKEKENYADSFKTDIIIYFDDDFTESNRSLSFLNKLSSFAEIQNWVDNLTSKFVMKFDAEHEQENDFIEYYING